MIFKATEIVNFAQGELLGAYVHYLIMVTVFRLPSLPAVVLSLALVAAYSAVAERLICRPC